METNEKREMSPEERRRRREARRRREQEMKRRKKKRLLLIAGILAGIVVLGLLIFGMIKLFSGGPKEISAKNGNFVIAIDAGHGGEDTGMSNGEAIEKQVTLDICSKLKIMLESQGYDVIMTREEDSRVSKEDRVSTANASQADLLVSVHCGYSDNSSLTGAVSHYKADSKESAYLAENIQAALVKENGALDGGFAEGDYTIVSDTEMPAVLVETGYLSNSQEAAKLADDAYQTDTAKGIAKGIILSLNREN